MKRGAKLWQQVCKIDDSHVLCGPATNSSTVVPRSPNRSTNSCRVEAAPRSRAHWAVVRDLCRNRTGWGPTTYSSGRRLEVSAAKCIKSWKTVRLRIASVPLPGPNADFELNDPAIGF